MLNFTNQQLLITIPDQELGSNPDEPSLLEAEAADRSGQRDHHHGRPRRQPLRQQQAHDPQSTAQQDNLGE